MRLASKLAGWDIDIITEVELERELKREEAEKTTEEEIEEATLNNKDADVNKQI
ncbi:MAG: hypothetical protein MRK02_06845 [Candidatus Scalindua sp.]|nr:hypothetical protein [Candidatus Scalindua sp.]